MLMNARQEIVTDVWRSVERVSVLQVVRKKVTATDVASSCGMWPVNPDILDGCVRISFLAASHSKQKLQDKRDAQWEYGGSCKSCWRKAGRAHSNDIDLILPWETGSVSDLNQPSGSGAGKIWVSPLWANETRRRKTKAQNVINICLQKQFLLKGNE